MSQTTDFQKGFFYCNSDQGEGGGGDLRGASFNRTEMVFFQTAEMRNGLIMARVVLRGFFSSDFDLST